MNGNHTKEWLHHLRKLPDGKGGDVLLVSGGKGRHFGGLRNAPAETLFEAALRYLAVPVYEEIIVFSGCGDHLPPDVKVSPGFVLGIHAGAWQLRGAVKEDEGRKRQEKRASESKPGFIDFDDEDLIGPATGQVDRALFLTHNMEWAEKMSRFLQTVGKILGLELDQNLQFRKAGPLREKRHLVIVDSQFLMPRPVDSLESFQKNAFQAAFNALPDLMKGGKPDLCKGCTLDMAILFPCQENADRFVEGRFLHQEHAQIQSFPELRWNLPVIQWQTIDKQAPFGRFLPDAGATQRLYDVLRTVKPTVPKGPIDELRGMVGMEDVIRRVERIQTTLRINKKKKEFNMPVEEEFNLHTVFYGNPGTGKTTVAKILARIYAEMGVLRGSKVTTVSFEELIDRYVAHTAPKTRALCERALGGVLFIDEAYQLTGEGTRQFGEEALSTLQVWLNEHQGELAVFFAGYKDEMIEFVKANKGTVGKIKYHIEFRDYTDKELLQIALNSLEKGGYEISDDTTRAMEERIRDYREQFQKRGFAFRNAGTVEILLASVREAQSQRLADMEQRRVTLDAQQVKAITVEDVKTARLDLAPEKDGPRGRT